jgi:peptide/nickel transport system permease protein
MPAVEPELDHGGTLPGGVPATAVVVEVDAAAAADAPAPRKRRNIGLWCAGVWLVVLGLLTLLAPILPFLENPDKIGVGGVEDSPSFEHWMGTDQNGRDLFARVVWGGRVSLTIGILALLLGFFIGGLIGITAGYFRGRYEQFTMSGIDIMLSFPSLILALALLRALSPPNETAGSLGKVTFVLTVLAVPALARITRANTLVYSQREFVTAAKALGAKPRRILRKEILPNVVPAMISFSFVALAILVVAEGALSFLGLSVKAPAATWGKLIQAGSEKLDEAPHLALMPCAVMFLTLLALNFIGDKLQSRFSAQESKL